MRKNDQFYNRYRHIRERCVFVGSKDYARYGGRGITFDWPDFTSFKRDMYDSFIEHVELYGEKNTTIDRINNDLGYSKENCRWATTSVQSRNKKVNRYITYKGKTMVIADWARSLGTSRQTVRHRLEAGWTPKQIVETPIDHRNNSTNRRKNSRNTSGITGVSWDKAKRMWVASIGNNKEVRFFKDKADAILHRKSLEKKYKYYVTGRSVQNT